MGVELALVTVIGGLSFGGTALLLIFGFKPGSISGWLALLGLGYLIGLAAFMILAQLFLVIGLPVWSALVIVASIPLVLLKTPLPKPAKAPRWFGVDRLAVDFFVLVIAVLLIVGSITAIENPLFNWDGWSIWIRKALILEDGLGPYFTNSAYEFMHPDYPVGLPALQATFFTLAGEAATTEADLPIWLMLPAFGLGVGLLAPTRPIFWVPTVSALLMLPFMTEWGLTNCADVPTAILLGLALLVGGRWLSERRNWQLWIFSLLIAGAMCTKNEGLVIGFILMIGITVLGWKERQRLIQAWAVVLVAFLPWRAWTMINGLDSDLQVEKLADPAYLVANIDRAWLSSGRLLEQLLFGLMGIDLILWVAFLIGGTLLLITSWRQLGARFALAGLLGSFTALVVAYWISPHELEWHLTYSANRVVINPVVILVMGFLLTMETATGRFNRGRYDLADSVPRV